MVVTSPVCETIRTQWLPESATYRLPSASMARPLGAWKAASLPKPSRCLAAPQPTSTDTCPSGEMEAMELEW
eukprot:scaffold5705_cov122-Isochrysis_galbana.AAC.3